MVSPIAARRFWSKFSSIVARIALIRESVSPIKPLSIATSAVIKKYLSCFSMLSRVGIVI
jgi:hypothetical protein